MQDGRTPSSFEKTTLLRRLQQLSHTQWYYKGAAKTHRKWTDNWSGDCQTVGPVVAPARDYLVVVTREIVSALTSGDHQALCPLR